MEKYQAAIRKQSLKYVTKLELYNKCFEQRVKDFFTTETKKCLVLETKDTRTGTLRIKKIISQLQPPLSTKYGGARDQIFLKWEQLLNKIGPLKTLPKFGNLLVLELACSEPEYNNVYILQTLIERINMVPLKKAILVFSHRNCPDTYLKAVDLDAFLKIDEFNNEVTSLTDSDHTELLYEAAASGRINHVSALLENGAKINEPGNDRGNTALHGAAEYGDKKLVLTLLRKGALIKVNKSGDTPLHVAAEHGHNDTVLALLEYVDDHFSVNINSANISGKTALHLAANVGAYLVVNSLLEHGAKVNCKDEDECTPLHFAAGFQETEMVKVLIQKGASIESRNKWGETPRDIARQHGYDRIEELLTLKKNISRLSVNLGMIWNDS